MELRKEIDELVALYSLEPQLRDVYVEGVNDKNLLEWFLADHGETSIGVYSIDTINIPSELVVQHGLEAGSNRSRVITLSEELAGHLPNESRILCIVDRDHEDFIPCGKANRYLGFTDYTSTDLYLLRPKTVRKLVRLVLGGMAVSADDLYQEIVGVLGEIFLLRLTNVALGWNMEWVPFTRYMDIDNGLVFGEDRFTKAYLQKNDRWAWRDKFEEKREELRAQLGDDPRSRIRGHDLMELLYWVAKKMRPSRRFGDVSTFGGAFLGCLERQDIQEEPMFQRVCALALDDVLEG